MVHANELLQAAKKFRDAMPSLQGYGIRVAWPQRDGYRIMFQKLNSRGNMVGFDFYISATFC